MAEKESAPAKAGATGEAMSKSSSSKYSMEAVDIAIQCARRGWRVFPVRIEPYGDAGKTKKTPCIKWADGATTDENEIRRLFRQFRGEDIAVGVATGQRSNVYVVDVDREEALAEAGFELAGGKQVRSNRSGGRHIYFGPPLDGGKVKNVARDGLDLRGDGGFVVLWHDPPEGTLAPLPGEVASWARGGTNEGGRAETLAEEIHEGGREAALVSLAGSMRRRGSSRAAIFAAISAENAERCRPPLPDEDLERIADSIAGYQPEGVPADSAVLTALRARRSRGDRPSRLMTLEELESLPDPVWIVEGCIPDGGVGQIYGPTNIGKSFVTLDLAMRIANPPSDPSRPRKWCGGVVNQHGPVVYCLMEGAFDWRDRVRAWLAAHPDDTAKNLLTLVEEPVNLADQLSVDLLLEDIGALKIDPRLIVIDTLALATPGVEENSNTDMGLVMSNLKRIASDLGCAVVTVHHTGKDASKGARGASAVKAALDFEASVTDGRIEFTKMKAGPKPAPWTFELKPAGPGVWAAPGNVVTGFLKRRQSIIDVLRSNGGKFRTKTALKAKVGGNGDAVGREITAMMEAGLIVKGDDGAFYLAEDI